MDELSRETRDGILVGGAFGEALCTLYGVTFEASDEGGIELFTALRLAQAFERAHDLTFDEARRLVLELVG